jgi:GAF domain-containing protein
MRLHSVARLARILAEPQELVDLLETAAHEACTSLGAASVSIGYLERERGTVRTVINVGDLSSWEEPRPLDQGFQDLPSFPLLLKDPSPFVVSLDPPVGDDDALRYLTLRNKGSAVVAPILLEGRVWGELYATRLSSQEPFNEEDGQLAEVLSAVLASGIAQAERFSQVEHLVYSDPLTGLANRRAVDLALERALVEYQVSGDPVWIIGPISNHDNL